MTVRVLTYEGATAVTDTFPGYQVLFLYSNAALLKLLGNGTYAILFPSFLVI